MQKVRTVIDRILEWILIALTGVSVINVLWQVFTRFVLQNPSSITEELARYLLIWVGVLGAAYCVGRRMHLAIDLLPLSLQGRNRQYLEAFIQAIIFFFALFVMVVGGFRLVGITLFLEQTSAALQWKLGYVYAVLPLSGLLIMYYAAVNALEALRSPLGRGGPEPPEEPLLVE